MKLAGRDILNEFALSHADAAAALAIWIAEIEVSAWKTPADLKGRYPSASILGKNHYVFNIKGNTYRLDTKINFVAGQVLVKRIGTHAEYDKWKFE